MEWLINYGWFAFGLSLGYLLNGMFALGKSADDDVSDEPHGM